MIYIFITSLLSSLLSKWALVALCVAATTGAHAESWVAMDNGKSFRYEFDADSVERITNGEYRVKWRWGREFVDDFSLDSLRVECGKQMVVTEHSTSINRRMYPSDPDKQVFIRDFIDGTSTSFMGKKPLYPDEKIRAVNFPASGSPESRLVRALCQNEPGFMQLHEFTGDDVQKKWGCGTMGLSGAAMCKTDLETRELLGQLITRLSQVERACAIGSEQANLLGRVWLKHAEKCSENTCDLGAMRIGVAGLGKDLSGALAGQPCGFVASSIANAQQDEAREASVTRFRECIVTTIPELDDKISPANVVAEGIYAACRGQLAPDLARSATFATTVLPGVTSQVLRARQERRKETATPQTKPAVKPKLSKSTGSSV